MIISVETVIITEAFMDPDSFLYTFISLYTQSMWLFDVLAVLPMMTDE